MQIIIVENNIYLHFFLSRLVFSINTYIHNIRGNQYSYFFFYYLIMRIFLYYIQLFATILDANN